MEMTLIFPAFFDASSTFLKCSGILAWVSKLSTTLKSAAYSGVILGRSVALPPQRMRTSILSFHSAAFAADTTGTFSVAILSDAGSRRVNTAASSVSGLCLMAFSTPRPRLPYPIIPMRII